MSDRQVTITQMGASRRFGVSDRTIRRWERAKLITAKRVGNLKLYDLAKIESLVGVRDEADAKYVSKRVREMAPGQAA